jgi:hypothetical protein
MKKSYLTAVLTLTCLLGVGISARAQDTEGVRVQVPFEFMVEAPLCPPAHTPLAVSLWTHIQS